MSYNELEFPGLASHVYLCLSSPEPHACFREKGASTPVKCLVSTKDADNTEDPDYLPQPFA